MAATPCHAACTASEGVNETGVPAMALAARGDILIPLQSKYLLTVYRGFIFPNPIITGNKIHSKITLLCGEEISGKLSLPFPEPRLKIEPGRTIAIRRFICS